MSVVTSVSTVGSKKLPPNLYVDGGRRVAASDHLGALPDRLGMCASTFSTAFMSIIGPITTPGLNPSATSIAPAISARRLVIAP